MDCIYYPTEDEALSLVERAKLNKAKLQAALKEANSILDESEIVLHEAAVRVNMGLPVGVKLDAPTQYRVDVHTSHCCRHSCKYGPGSHCTVKDLEAPADYKCGCNEGEFW